MLKSCSRCGKIHDSNKKCYSNSKQYYQPNKEIRKFRNSTQWINKSLEIRERDKNLCQICLKHNIFNYKNLSVHHIIPLATNMGLSLENTNLITLCSECHKEAEESKISAEELKKIVDETMKDY